MRNFGLKIFSLLMAVLLSYYVQSAGSESVIALTVPVELRGMPADLVVTAPFPREVQISLKGPAYLISQVYSSPPSFKVRVPQNTTTRLTASFDRSELGLPPAIQVMSIEPSEMIFTFDKLIRKEVPVQLVLNPSKGAPKISDTIIVPPRVVISGPEAEVFGIKAIETEPVDAKDISTEVEKNLILKRVGKLTELSSGQVSVKFLLAKEQIEKKFTAVPVEIRSMHTQAVIIAPSKVDLEISGPKDKVEILTANDVVPYVRLGAEDGLGEKYDVNVDLPKSISLVVVEPSQVKVSPAAAGQKGK